MIEVGEYVRTIGGYIIKYKNKNENIFNCDNKQYIESSLFPDEEQIVKHSKNIIDLIEEGDYVNGFQVWKFDDMYDEKTDTYEDGLAIPIYDDALMDCIEEVRPLNTIDIKSIVTKEQMKSVEYIVKEE